LSTAEDDVWMEERKAAGGDWTDPRYHEPYLLDTDLFPGSDGNCYTCGLADKEHGGFPPARGEGEERVDPRENHYRYMKPDRLLPHDQILLDDMAKMVQPFTWDMCVEMYADKNRKAERSIQVPLGRLIRAGRVRVVRRGLYTTLDEKGLRL
jgi:hypothetical protein